MKRFYLNLGYIESEIKANKNTQITSVEMYEEKTKKQNTPTYVWYLSGFSLLD